MATREWQLFEPVCVLYTLVAAALAAGGHGVVETVMTPLVREWGAMNRLFSQKGRFVAVFCDEPPGMLLSVPWAVLEKCLCGFETISGLFLQDAHTRHFAGELASSVAALVRMLQEVRAAPFLQRVDRIWSLAYTVLGKLAQCAQLRTELLVLPCSVLASSPSVLSAFWDAFCIPITQVMHSEKVAAFVSMLSEQAATFVKNPPIDVKKADLASFVKAALTFWTRILAMTVPHSCQECCVRFLCIALDWPGTAPNQAARALLCWTGADAHGALRQAWLCVLRCCGGHLNSARKAEQCSQIAKLTAKTYVLLAGCQEAADILCAVGFSQEVCSQWEVFFLRTQRSRRAKKDPKTDPTLVSNSWAVN
ncbi:hypothetical protein DIPPA_09242 [Diplonema papillatum]|nr:hypothetical protein DIPPA_23331 [Diplonema papillatum]KAJ9445171.1 hypothetical protein DIPPA_09242 [Diplonema papillatum]